MAKINSISIKNFRGIKQLDHSFGQAKFICLVGRGDSCKSTILEAISYALYPNWNLSVNDSDFYNCDTASALEIEVTLSDLDEHLLRENKYGLYIRGLLPNGTVSLTPSNDSEPVLTVALKVEKDLEPRWKVLSGRPHLEDAKFETSDRAALNVFLLSDYVDRHFTWAKGSPLYALLRQDGATADSSVLLDEVRKLKAGIDGVGFSHLDAALNRVKDAAQKMGLDIDSANTSVDLRDLSIKDSKIILHDEAVPFRMKGKGSKRLISAAIQTELGAGGVMLVDEIEQGLEPDRVKHLVRTFYCAQNEQFFLTTHSQQVVEELEPENIFVVRNDAGNVTITQISEGDGERFKSLYRTCPEALYADSVIMCEGKTEIGFCRAFDAFRVGANQDSLASKGVVYSLGGGDGFNKKAMLLKKELGKRVAVFCDSDKDAEIGKPTKEEMAALGIAIVDCPTGCNIERLISAELPWEALEDLCEYVRADKGAKDFKEYVKASTGIVLGDADSTESRDAFFKACTFKKEKAGGKAEDRSWFKRIDHGEVLGEVCMRHKGSLDPASPLSGIIQNLDKWADGL